MKNQRSSIKKRIIHMLLLFSGICLFASVMILLGLNGIGIPCVFYKATGLQCPGCGNSRAVLSLIRGDIGAAFSYNALFLPELLYLLWVYGVCTVNYIKGIGFSYLKRPLPAIDYIVLAAIAIWSVVRNVI